MVVMVMDGSTVGDLGSQAARREMQRDGIPSKISDPLPGAVGSAGLGVLEPQRE